MKRVLENCNISQKDNSSYQEIPVNCGALFEIFRHCKIKRIFRLFVIFFKPTCEFSFLISLHSLFCNYHLLISTDRIYIFWRACQSTRNGLALAKSFIYLPYNKALRFSQTVGLNGLTFLWEPFSTLGVTKTKINFKKFL